MKIPIVFASLFLFLLSCSGGGDKVSFGYLDVYYTDGVTKAEALEVGDYLSGIGFGLEDKGEKIQLGKVDGRYTCKFVMPDGKVSLENIWRRYGNSISKSVLNNAPVDVYLCDDDFNTLKFLPAAQ